MIYIQILTYTCEQIPCIGSNMATQVSGLIKPLPIITEYQLLLSINSGLIFLEESYGYTIRITTFLTKTRCLG